MLETLMILTIIRGTQISTESYIMTSPQACEALKQEIILGNNKSLELDNIRYNVNCAKAPYINNMNSFKSKVN